MENSAIHHLHKRKRIHSKHEEYPSKKKFVRRLDKIVYVVGVLGPVMTIPQIAKIWINKTAGNISLISWIAYLLFAFVLMFYGIVHKEKPLILMYFLWIIVDAFVVIGILLYG